MYVLYELNDFICFDRLVRVGVLWRKDSMVLNRQRGIPQLCRIIILATWISNGYSTE